MFKKLISLSLAFTFSVVMSLPAGASEVYSQNDSNSLSSLEINYDLDTGHNNRSKKEILDDLVNQGVNYEDAEYYAKLDILASKLEQEGIKINFDEIESYPAEYSAYNMFEIRKKALELDKKAIKSLFEHSSVMENGNKDLKSLVKSQSLDVLKSSDALGKTTVKYPDGSSITMNAESVLIKADDSYTTDTNWPGPWSGPFGDADMYKQGEVTSSGNWYNTNDVQFTSPSYWARVNNTYTYQIKNNGSTDRNKWSVHYIESTGASSGSGFITVNTESYQHQGESAVGNDYIQGYTDARFTVSTSVGGSISFAGVALNFSVTGGDFWHQYAINEVCGYGITLHWEAYYI
jgi:hypothetical protein